MIKLCTNNDKTSIVKELEKLRDFVENDLKKIVSKCIEKVMKAENNELQEVIDFPLD